MSEPGFGLLGRLAVMVWACGLSAVAAAQGGAEPGSVRLHVPDCSGVVGEQVRSLVALELAPRLRVDAGDGAADIVGTVACSGQRVRIEIRTPEQAAPLRLELDLAAVPVQARTRLLALSIAELIATGRLEHTPPSPAAAERGAQTAAAGRAAPSASAEKAGAAGSAEKADAAASAERAAQAATTEKGAASGSAEIADASAESTDASGSAAPAPWALWLAPGLSRMGDPGLTLLGVEAGASYTLGPLSLLAQLQARWGAADTLAADVDVRTYSGALAIAPRLSLGALEFALGPGLRVGHARLSGRPAQPGLLGAAVSGVWLGPCALASVQLRFAPWAAVRAGFELGYVTQSVRGLDHESRRLLDLDGAWTSASVGAALLLR